jgi:transposase InsO family protein
MDTKQKEEENRRKHILQFWKRHGLAATKEAFGVSRPTLFRWLADPTPKSKAHRSGYLKRTINPLIEAEIRRLRGDHPRLGKEKVAPLLAVFCTAHDLPVLSEPTVGRIIADMKATGKLVLPVRLRLDGRTGTLVEKKPLPKKVKLRRSGYLPEHPGDLLQVDGVLTLVDGKRRYTFTAIDLVSRWAYSRTYSSASSKNGKDFLERLLETALFTVKRLQTDNGGEFLALFQAAAEEAGIVHFFNWVKQPKYQGWVERFNRSIQEEFLDWKPTLLSGPTEDLNSELEEWLVWYNGSRIHRGLNVKTPLGIQKRTPLQYLALTAQSQTG